MGIPILLRQYLKIESPAWDSEMDPMQILTHWGRDKMTTIFQPDAIFKCIFFDENV